MNLIPHMILNRFVFTQKFQTLTMVLSKNWNNNMTGRQTPQLSKSRKWKILTEGGMAVQAFYIFADQF